jgi:hypothetical protein
MELPLQLSLGDSLGKTTQEMKLQGLAPAQRPPAEVRRPEAGQSLRAGGRVGCQPQGPGFHSTQQSLCMCVLCDY